MLSVVVEMEGVYRQEGGERKLVAEEKKEDCFRLGRLFLEVRVAWGRKEQGF